MLNLVQSTSENQFAQATTSRLGELEVVSLLDGYINTPLSVFDGPEAESFESMLARAGLSGPQMRTAVSCFLIKDENRVILIDTGMGNLGGATLGHLGASLAQIGLLPTDITDVVLTHLHRDHCGGILNASGSFVFPGAKIHVSREEYDYWTSAEEWRLAPENTKRFFEPAQRAMNACQANLHLFGHSERLTSRVRVSRLAGHTKGHTAVWFESGSDVLCIWGDVIHCAALQMQAPETTVSFDTDPGMAIATRKSILQSSSDNNFWVAGAHLPFPSIGKVRETALESYEFQSYPE